PASPVCAPASLGTFGIVAGERKGFVPRSNAATAAECGAAAEVPKKRQAGGHSGKPPAFVMLTPSNAARSGLGRVSGAGKPIVVGPRELKDSTSPRPGSAIST